MIRLQKQILFFNMCKDVGFELKFFILLDAKEHNLIG